MNEYIREQIKEINRTAQGLANRITFAKQQVAKFTRLHDVAQDNKKDAYQIRLKDWIDKLDVAKKALEDYKPELNALFPEPTDQPKFVKKINLKERKLGRSEDYYQLSPEDQYEEDSRLGLLEWSGYDIPTRKMKKKQTIEE